MSYLKEASADESTEGKSLNKAIISLWIKTNSKGPEDKWKQSWLPPKLDTLLSSSTVMYSGGNYWTGLTGEGTQVQAPHLWAWPPGPEVMAQSENEARTFKDSMVPFLTWGEVKTKYKRVEWKKKVLRGDYWVFGRGGKANELISQYPEKVGEEEGVVPPSCIGVDSKTGKLRIILQTTSHATYTGYAYTMSKAKCVFIQTPLLPVGGFGNAKGYKDFAGGNPLEGAFVGNAIWYEDVSSLEFGQHPETFIMDADDKLADGEWHHILLSFDLSGTVTVEATGDKADPPLPGTYGQYSGADGDIALAPLRYVMNGPEGPNGTFTYAQKAGYGAPFEENGTGTGPCDKGTIASACKAWLYVDGKRKEGRELHHAGVWAMVKDRVATHADFSAGPANIDMSALEGTDAIVPVNALVALTGDPRLQIVTSQTAWERDYRTFLGKFLGPKCIIDGTDEKRRYSYDAPKYVLGECRVARGKFTIPAGEVFGDLKWNLDIKIAELFIWTDQAEDPADLLTYFLKDGKPVPPSEDLENRLGKPNFALHYSSNWKKGKNTGKDGYREVGLGEEKTKEINVEGQFSPTGKIDRFMPDPQLGGGGGGIGSA